MNARNRRLRTRAAIGIAVASAALASLVYFLAPRGKTPEQARYVGAAACGGCHAEQARAWTGSDHQLAMQPAREGTVLGNFNDVRFDYAGVRSRFWKREGRYYVNSDGPDGKLADFEIRYTFGLRPLQQYLIALPGGRLQAFAIAWDSRDRAAGGQRWFHLYPDERLKAGDSLHWTSVNQNWNYMCSECHATDAHKAYDAATKSYNTTWSEIGIGCEACHGPGSRHLAWAQSGARGEDKGLANRLDERRGISWTPSRDAAPPQRSAPLAGSREFDTCSRCHARATRIADGYAHGGPPLDSHRPALLSEGLYWNDGQQREEVFTWGSYAQSRMAAKGVICSDCHEPHGLKLRAQGNALCTRCHSAASFDAPEHSHHAPGSAGAACIACHMPATTYMRVDPRHDHALRPPRPDLSARHDRLPNACNQCHRERTAAWAAQALQRWTGKPPQPGQADAFFAAQAGEPGARGLLQALIDDTAQPAIVRASAIERLAPLITPQSMPSVLRGLDANDALLRLASVEALGTLAPAQRGLHLPRMLGDAVLAVRSAAARALAGPAERGLSAAEKAAFDLALRDHVATLEYNADRPEAQMSLGNLLASRGDAAGAELRYREAIRIDPGFVEGYVNLADLQRSRGQETEAEAVLREGLRHAASAAQAAALQHALGLALIRQKRGPEARAALAEAARREPDNARYAYVYAVALDESGAGARAQELLQAALARHPNDPELLSALARYAARAGKRAAAMDYATRLQGLDPDNPQYRRLAEQLRR